MADKKESSDESKTQPENGETGSLTMADIRNLVRDTIKELIPGQTPPKDEKNDSADSSKDGAPNAGSLDLRSQVQREIERIKSKEQREERDKSIDAQLAELAEKTKEKSPLDRPKRHKIMGWGD